MAKNYDKDEILKLYKEGMSKRGIAKHISGQKEGVEFERARGMVMHHLRSADTFEKTLGEHNFALPENWEYGWLKTKGASVFVKNSNLGASFEDMRAEFIQTLKSYSPNYKAVPRNTIAEPHLLVVDIADLHLGKLGASSQTGESYNVDIAIQRAIQGVEGLLTKASGFPIEKILFVIGNDVLHTDNAQGTTTKGTRQDTDGMWFDNYKRAREMYVRIIEMLLTVADVHVVHNPSNHDYVTGYMLADSVFSWYRNHPQVTFDITNANRKYYQYGENLIGTTHGDGARMDELPLLMANEAKRLWAETSHRYFYLHHLHHKQDFRFTKGKDYNGVNIEYLRSPSSADDYHHKEGYTHSPKAIEGFIHHREQGQVARLVHLFK